MTRCVYALTLRPAAGTVTRLSLRGLSGERLRLLGDGPVAAIVGELPRPPRPSAGSLRRYDTVIRALATRMPAVLPARFGTCFEELDELTFVLRSRERSLHRAISHVRGRVQMTTRIIERASGGSGAGASAGIGVGVRGEAARVNEAVGASGGRGAGYAYLLARAEAAAREHDIPGFQLARDAVRRWVRDERVEKRAGISTVYHLVPRGSAERYRAAIERAAAAAALPVVVSGPWPAYAFAGW